jgi:hypothetical protein
MPASSARSRIEYAERRLDLLREFFNRKPPPTLRQSPSFSFENSREALLSRLNWPFRLLLPPLAEDAMLAVDIRGPGSVLTTPKPEESSCPPFDETNDALELDRNSEESAGVLRGDRDERGDRGFVGALAMRTTGAIAASSGCRNASSSPSSFILNAP